MRSASLGILALTLFTIHEVVFILRGQPANGLWTCNVGLLAIAIGLLIRSPLCNAVGTFWMTAGFPLWIVDMMLAGGPQSTSVMTHVGGLILGYLAMKRLGLPERTWVVSILALGVLVLISRPLTPPADNINFSYRVYDGVSKIFPSYWSYMLALMMAFIAFFAALQWGLRKAAFTASTPSTERTLPDVRA